MGLRHYSEVVAGTARWPTAALAQFALADGGGCGLPLCGCPFIEKQEELDRLRLPCSSFVPVTAGPGTPHVRPWTHACDSAAAGTCLYQGNICKAVVLKSICGCVWLLVPDCKMRPRYGCPAAELKGISRRHGSWRSQAPRRIKPACSKVKSF